LSGQLYIKESTVQKTKLYDMYARFFRWASDRIKDEGIIAFVSNRSFRKIVARDFKEILVVDLGGDVRANPKLSGTKHNVFGIQTGVAISFFGEAQRHRRLPHTLRAQTRDGDRRGETFFSFDRSRRRAPIRRGEA
jgi:predicted helicase